MSVRDLIETPISYLVNSDPYIVGFLRSLDIRINNKLPAPAALCWNPRNKEFCIEIQEEMFGKLSIEERAAVYIHEFLHFLHNHIQRMPESFDKKISNVAQDMSINQLIRGLPEWTINVKTFKMKDGKPFPTGLGWEAYYNLLMESDHVKKIQAGEGEPGVDDHSMWDEMAPEEQEEVMREARNTAGRAKDLGDKIAGQSGNNRGQSKYAGDGAGSINEFIERINHALNSNEAKRIISQAIRKSASHSERKNTWNRPNKRYGYTAPGRKVSETPLLKFYIDTSGSIDYSIIQKALRTVDSFLSIGARRTEIGWWHTDLYRTDKYKLGQDYEIKVTSGGTDLTGVQKDIATTNPDLSLIITDGYYSHSDIPLTGQIIFLICEGGTMDHPLSKQYESVKLEKFIA